MAQVIDLNDARPQGHYSSRQLTEPDYVRDLKGRMANNYRSILQHLWPAGRFNGPEFEVGDVHGSAGKSFKISCRSDKLGVGCDFAGNETCSDLIDAWALATRGRPARGREFAQMCDEIEGFLGAPFKASKPQAPEPAKPEDLGPPTATYTYTDAQGAPLVQVRRYELAETDARGKPKKEFRPWLVAERKTKMPEANRPLYNQTGILSEPSVVFVEGEKAAEALIKAGIPATCAMAGSNAPTSKTDWSPLAGKQVTIWPDHDDTGEKYAQKVKEALTGIATSVAVVTVPGGQPEGWDAADAVAEGLDVRAILHAAWVKPAQPKGRVIDLQAWHVSRFCGLPKEVEWIIQDVMPRSTAGLLVAMGDAGKGILTLDLALKVALPKHDADGVLNDPPMAFGGEVVATGPVVLFLAEDDMDEVHRRLHRLDPEGRRADAPLYIIPLPNAGGPMPIVKTSSTEGLYVTDEWHQIVALLKEIKPVLVGFDPMASFVHADINADPAAGAFVTGLLAGLATELNATVLVAHHMSKTRAPISTPEEARAAIRGSSAIVDGVRYAYALWAMEEQHGRRVCKALGVEWSRNFLFQGAIVKSNAPADRSIRTYARDMHTGLLVDRSERVTANRSMRHELEQEELVNAIASAAAAGYPFTVTGSTGIHERRGELPETFRDISRDRLRKLADDLVAAGRLARVRYKGQSSPWLDEPGGDFARGHIELALGAYQPKP
jgi:hypothetical protein